MKTNLTFLAMVIITLSGLAQNTAPITKNKRKVLTETKSTLTTGAEQTEKYFGYLKGKRVAMLANPTTIIGKRHLVDSLISAGINVVKVFGPEHGFRGNAEGGYNEKAMGITIAWWSLLFYACAILVWNVYRFQNKRWTWLLRGIGAVGLVILAIVYKAGEDGSQGMTPHWWGILGLIGWAYLFSCIIYQLVRGRILLLLLSITACVAWYVISKADTAKDNLVLQWMAARAGHAAHTSIVLCGMVVSLLFFDAAILRKIYERFIAACVFALMAALAGYWIRPYYRISKIYSTPTWCLYSVAICTMIFCLLYWLIDILKYQRWTTFFQPAAANSLLVYILPAIIMYLQIATGLYFMPAEFHQGVLGIAWSVCYAIFIMVLAMGLNKLKIRLQL